MKRPFTLTSKQEKEASGSYSKASKKSQDYLDGNASPDSYDNSHSSDNDSVSYESRKIRKKRNTYHKISDDIRMDLLESVQNGETLKSAAKRHNINYSSAKSILHTYRKEGRILKKSVQERNFKKKPEAVDSDVEETPKKKKKAAKKDNSQLPYVTTAVEETLDCSPEETASQVVRKSERIRMNAESTQPSHSDTASNSQGENSQTVVTSQEQDQTYQSEQPAVAMASGPAYAQGQYLDQYYPNAEEDHHMNYHNDHKLFDNFFTTYPEQQHYNNTVRYDGQEDNYHNYYPKEFDSFNEMMDTLQNKTTRYDAYQDSNSFLCSREVNTSHLFEERSRKSATEGHSDNTCENPLNFAFKSFMEAQNMFRDTLRESPFRNNENSFRYRKDSVDFS